MSAIGIILLLCAGFAQGSFGLGMKKQAPLKWESFWLIYSLMGMVIVPLIWGLLSSGVFFQSIAATPWQTIFKALLLGFLWGIGGIMFGLSVRMLGVSITMGVVMGLAGGLGALIPLLGIEGVTSMRSFPVVLIGVGIMLVGVWLTALSGIKRDREQKVSQQGGNNENKNENLKKGIILVVLTGVLSSLLNIGFEAAEPIRAQALALGASPAGSSLPARAVVVFGGFLMNAGYAVWLLCRNRTWGDLLVFRASAPQGALKAAGWAKITGILWFIPLGLAGIVAASLGSMGNAITWPVMLGLSLIFGNLWGYLSGEWKGAKRSFGLMIVAAVVLIVACLVLTFKDSF